MLKVPYIKSKSKNCHKQTIIPNTNPISLIIISIIKLSNETLNKAFIKLISEAITLFYKKKNTTHRIR